jgi:hypothetical protein
LTCYRRALLCSAFLWSAALSGPAGAQARPTAGLGSRISFFGGATGTLTGLYAGRDAGITAGVDVEAFRLFGLHPAVEVRGTYPFWDDGIVNLRNVMGGLRVEKRFGVVHPYGDFLYGRGELNYPGGGLYSRDGTLIYLESLSNVYSPGGGVDVDLTRHFALKVDAQLQHYNSPISSTGSEWAKAGTIGVVYRLGFKGYRYGH